MTIITVINTRVCKGFLLLMLLAPFRLLAQEKIAIAAIDKSQASSLHHIFKKYSLFAIDVPALAMKGETKKGKILAVDFDLPGLSIGPVQLEENNVLAGEYRAVLATAMGETSMPKLEAVTYKGRMSTDANSSVYLTISPTRIEGFIKGNGKYYFIEPLRYFDKRADHAAFVVYEANDLQPQAAVECGVTALNQRSTELSNSIAQRASGTCRMVEVALASDYSMLLRFGSANELQEHNISILNMMVGLFQDAQFGSQYLEFRLKGQYISTAVSTDPVLDGYAGLEANLILTSFKNWGEAGNFNFSYDMAQLWTAKNISGNIVGLAYVGGICNTNKYQLLEDYGSISTKAILSAHETGHNFNALHDASTSSYIMAPSLSGMAQSFSPESRNVIANYISSPRGECLPGCDLVVPDVRITASSNGVCVTNSSVTFTDHSVGAVTSRQWSFPLANITSSGSISQTVSYATPGIKEAGLTVSNAAGAAQASKNIMVLSPSVPACRNIVAATTGETGMAKLHLAEIRFDGLWYMGARYRDYTCTAITRLQPGRTYNGLSYIGAPTIQMQNSIQLFIDYNNNGDFTDANELVAITTDCVIGDAPFSITTPQTVPVINTLLRMRLVIVPCNGTLVNGCEIPLNYQVYDFGVYFTEATCINTYYQDADMDGYGDPLVSYTGCSRPTGYATNNEDCDDANAAINPGTIWITDKDADGYYAGLPVVQCLKPGIDYLLRESQLPGDCNDYDATVNPGAVEVCGNGKDDNCNGITDETACYVCANATSMSTTGITTSSATLLWVSIPHPEEWQLRYKSTSPGSKWKEVFVPGHVRSFTLTGLINNQPYNWQIRTKCGKAWTEYSAALMFNTGGVPGFAADMRVTEPGYKLEAQVLPNPSTNHFKISVPGNDLKVPVQLIVTDMYGRKIESAVIPAGQVIILGGNYRSGYYIVNLVQANKTHRVKLVKL